MADNHCPTKHRSILLISRFKTVLKTVASAGCAVMLTRLIWGPSGDKLRYPIAVIFLLQTEADYLQWSLRQGPEIPNEAPVLNNTLSAAKIGTELKEQILLCVNSLTTLIHMLPPRLHINSNSRNLHKIGVLAYGFCPQQMETLETSINRTEKFLESKNIKQTTCLRERKHLFSNGNNYWYGCAYKSRC